MKQIIKILRKKLMNQVKKENQLIKYPYIESQTPYLNKDFVIISNNCWGAEIYKKANKEFNTPFIGLYIYAQDYIRLLENFDQLIKSPINFTGKSKWLESAISYPIGLLDQNIEIHFLHYKTEEEARQKWNRRVSRLIENLDYDKFFFRICDRDGANEEIIHQFHKLNYKNKISFGVKKIPNSKNHITIDERAGETVPDGILTFNLTNKYIDLPFWINTGIIKHNR